MGDVPVPHRREFSRVSVSPFVELTVNGALVPDAQVDNLSLRGMLIRTTARPAPDSSCGMLLKLGGTVAEVRATGKVVRCTDDGFAVRFTEIMGLDSLEHLRNLIRYNSHEPNQVEQEFNAHLGLQADV